MSTTDSAQIAAAPELTPRRSSRSLWRRFRRHRLALIGLAILLVFLVVAVIGPFLLQDPNSIDLPNKNSPPDRSHLLGTGKLGRDVLSRLVVAGRVSLTVGLVVAGISSVMGTFLGMVSGYVGGWVDNLIQRFTELAMTIPLFFAAILLVAIVGPGVFNIMWVLGVLTWPGKVRIVRGQLLSLREMDYVTAARALGARDRRLIFVHILPAVTPYVVVAATLTVAGAILTEASLSFLGIGVQIPTATWGNMMTDAQALHVLTHRHWLWVPPGLAISLTVIAVNLVGDGLRDALDPRTNVE